MSSFSRLSPMMSEPEGHEIAWEWAGKRVDIGLHRLGRGPSLLLLPALSSISTRREMRPLQAHLAQRYSTFCPDWPGFGDRPRPPSDWTPATYSAFLTFLLTSVIPPPCAIVAAGHAATYALEHAAGASQAVSRLVMIAPTWRGPLPTMMGGRRRWFDRLCRLVDLPGLGPLIYWLNVNRLVVRHMAAGHVYADPAFLDGERLREKLAVVRAPGARFASVRFVTGRLDPLASREEFLDLARRATVPILLVFGADTPRRSLAEMEALAALPAVRSIRIPRGKLSVHEEFPDATSEAVLPFLGEEPPAGR